MTYFPPSRDIWIPAVLHAPSSCHPQESAFHTTIPCLRCLCVLLQRSSPTGGAYRKIYEGWGQGEGITTSSHLLLLSVVSVTGGWSAFQDRQGGGALWALANTWCFFCFLPCTWLLWHCFWKPCAFIHPAWPPPPQAPCCCCPPAAWNKHHPELCVWPTRVRLRLKISQGLEFYQVEERTRTFQKLLCFIKCLIVRWNSFCWNALALKCNFSTPHSHASVRISWNITMI